MNAAKKIFSSLSLFLIVIIQAVSPSPVFAAGIVGTGTPASCTEAALDTKLAGGGLVNFDCGGGSLTIHLTTTKAISSNTQIDGGGLITLSGDNSVRLFTVNTGVSLSITGLILTQGTASNDIGGAILANNNSTVNITNSTFSSNTSNSSSGTPPGSGHGGAIYAGSGSNINITNSGFSNNSAVGDTGTPPSSGNGGAIYADSGSTIHIDSSIFDGNSTTHGYGGALYVNGLTTAVTITDSTFSNNSAQVNTFDLSLGGGAIQNNDGTVTISGSTFNGNHVDGNGPDGGAIFNGDFDGDGGDVMTITNSTFENNFFNGLGGASAGGAVRSNGTITITYSTFSNNGDGVTVGSLDDGGAGAVTIAGGTGKLINSIFANTKGGGLDCVVRTANATLDLSSGGNLIQNHFECGTPVSSSDPILGSLQNNGGLTKTMALGALSPAIDSVPCIGSVTKDQRGTSRPQAASCDIGAFEFDQTAPNTTISANPTNPSADNTPAFSFTGDDGNGSGIASFECKMDSDSFTACTSGSTFGPLTDGSHTFQVRAVDHEGNIDATPASYTWTVDTTAPDTSITSNPPDPDNDSTPTFGFSSPDGSATFECKMDGGSFSACTSGSTFSSLADGSHTFQVRAVDAAGNRDLTPDSYTWTIDTTPLVGTYDDNEAHWVYVGNWSNFSGSGPSGNTLHYTSTVGNTASFSFKGTQFILSYTQNTNRANFEVYVDGNKIATVNANGAAQWQKTFTSPVFLSGKHVVQFKNIGVTGSVFDVDAIQVLDTSAPGAGKYDDGFFNWRYGGAWSTFSGSGPYNSTLHYTSTVGNTASFTFSGTQFILSYTQNPSRGSFEVYVDGNKVTTVNANGVAQWQKIYVSPVYAAGTHEVQFKHIGVTGSVFDVDSLQIFNGPIPGANKYDDNDANWSYSGSWLTFSGAGPYNDTLRYTATVGSTASFPFTGTQFILSYTQNTSRGSFEVYVDGSKIATVNASGAAQWQKTFISPIFAAGIHVAQIRNIGGSVSIIDVDAIEILDTPIPAAGKYDDSENWFYSGTWASYSGSGPFNDTIRYTGTVGNTAAFTFSGTQFLLSYTQATNRGSFEVYVDGSKIATVNANGAAQWQKAFTSPVFSVGTHVAQIKNIGGSSSIIDVDAIEILDTPIPGAGKYDDANANWFYYGTWFTLSASGPYSNTLHYTTAVGNWVWFPFSGTQFILTYTQNTNRGSFEVYVDGSKIATVNANGILQWQKTYTSPTLTAGTHIVQIKDIGGSASIIDVDAIQVLP